MKLWGTKFVRVQFARNQRREVAQIIWQILPYRPINEGKVGKILKVLYTYGYIKSCTFQNRNASRSTLDFGQNFGSLFTISISASRQKNGTMLDAF